MNVSPLKMSHLNLWILAFFTSLCPIKSGLSCNTVWPQAFRFSKSRQSWHFSLTFVHSKGKRSSLRSQCWMRLFKWFSNTVNAKDCYYILGNPIFIIIVICWPKSWLFWCLAKDDVFNEIRDLWHVMRMLGCIFDMHFHRYDNRRISDLSCLVIQLVEKSTKYYFEIIFEKAIRLGFHSF